MKKVLFLIFNLLFLILNFCIAQVPQGIPYQAVARNANGNLIASQAVSVRFSIIDSIATGTVVYSETFHPTTNTLGLFNLNIGQGTAVSGSFAAINWGTNNKFLKIELDPAGGSSYNDMGTTQMMSVPYALYSGSSALGGGPSSLVKVASVQGTTLTIITGVSDVVIVWAKGGLDNSSGFGKNIYLNYDGVQKDIIFTGSSSNEARAWALEYTEIPGAGTHDITVTSDGTVSQVVIIAQVITPVSGSNTSSSSPSSLLQQLISYWKLDGNSNDAVRSNNGTDNSITYSASNGKINQGAGLNGSNSYLQFPGNIVNYSNSFSTSFWVKISALPNFPGAALFEVANADNGGQNYGNPSIGIDNLGRIRVINKDPSGVLEGGSDIVLNSAIIGTWYNITYVFNSTIGTYGTCYSYLNGDLIFSGAFARPAPNFGTALTMGKSFDSYQTAYFNGSIDEVGIWSRVLTPAEILSLYNSGNGLSYPF